MRIAIIGGGISGLVCAHDLMCNHDIAIFESGRQAGGHSHTVDVDIEDEHHSIDTGFIVYNERTYPEFTRLLTTLGVSTQPTSMSFSVCCDRTGMEYGGASLNTLFSQRRNVARPGFWRMLRDMKRFMHNGDQLLSAPPELTLLMHAELAGYSQEFLQWYLLPLAGSLWSCPADRVQQFPMRFVAEFLANHGMLQMRDRPAWRVIQGGSKHYVEALIRPFTNRIHLNEPVLEVHRYPERVVVRSTKRLEQFDHVIFACHADQALGIISDPSCQELEILSSFPYQENEVVLHTDSSILPSRRALWSSWNYRVRDEASKAVAVTYNMNILQNLKSKHTFCVSLNQSDQIDPKYVLKRFLYHHPIQTVEGMNARGRHSEVANCRRSSFCGAYWGYGFHEDGVRSALAVCRSLEVESQ